METIAEAIADVRQRWELVAARGCSVDEHPGPCSDAEGPRVVWDGLRQRSVSVLVDESSVHVPDVVCRRLKCQACGLRWTRRPEGCLPRRHYQPCVMANAVAMVTLGDGSLTATATHFGIDRRTLGRWTHWTAQVAEPAALQRELIEATDEPVLVGTPVRALQRERHGPRADRYGRAAQVLALCVALASALGLSPPELGAVVSRYAGPLDGVTTDQAPAIAALTIPEDAHRPVR